MSLFNELKRRNVIKVGLAYIVVAWLILQVADVLLNNLGSPDWVFKTILFVLIAGLPVVLLFSWVFDWTPEGLQRTDDLTPESIVSAPNTVAIPSGPSVAVLPFVNMSGDPDNEYFSDGLTEELLNVLAKISALKVAARTSSFHFKGQTGDVTQIGRRLGVASVLEGSVRKSGAQVRITAQLINTADGYHLWSETFDRQLDDIFAVQDEISSAVADALQVKLLDGGADQGFIGGTSSAEAFQSYLLGVHHRNRGDHIETLRDAIAAFEEAVALDPGYAKAYAVLAKSWVQMAANSFCSYEEGTGKAEAAANKAIELAPNLADAYMAMTWVLSSLKHDYVAAQQAINKALTLNPGNAEILMEFARGRCYQGHAEDAILAARRALDLDPVSLTANHFLGHILYFSRRYDEAIPALRRTLEMNPDYPKPHYFISMALFWQGDVEAAWEEIQQEPLDWMRWAASSVILHRLGRVDEARENFANLAADDEQEFATIQRADVYAQWGDFESAFKNLDLAFKYGDPGLWQLAVDPFLDPISDDSRYQGMLRRLKLERPEH